MMGYINEIEKMELDRLEIEQVTRKMIEKDRVRDYIDKKI